jgi:antitoxin (DNA-binding transcriptional repressor) of toxin-antitoxin stability system
VKHTIGIAELKRHTSVILRRVRENQEWFDITYRGRVVACLVPVDRPADYTELDEAPKEKDWRKVWAAMDETAAEIAKYWPEGVSAVDAVREQRRILTRDEWGTPEESRR